MNKISTKLLFAISSALTITGLIFLFQVQAYWWDTHGLNWLAIVLGCIFILSGLWGFKIINGRSSKRNLND